MDPEDEPDIEAVHEHLVRAGTVAPVPLAGADERRWLDCDLASLAENRLGDRTDPRELDEARRASWQKRATDEREWSLTGRSKYERCYWLLEGGEPIGTIALATTAVGARSLRISSFYLFPPLRGRGAGKRALARVREAVAEHGFGIRLETSWCWQSAVRFYFAAGMWIYMWKRELTFCWYPDLPKAQLDIGEHDATLTVPVDGAPVVVARAHRRGDVLELADISNDLANDKRIAEAYWNADSTLAVALALNGWPLIRSREKWDKSYYADAGAPESLAYKIMVWEAKARASGWLVNTPRIPGLEYPTWAELEARWEEESKEFQKSLVVKKQ